MVGFMGTAVSSASIFKPIDEAENLFKSAHKSRNWTVAKYQFDRIKLNSTDIFQKLIKNGWAKEKNSIEVTLTVDLDKEKDFMVEVFDQDLSKILPILQQAQNEEFALTPIFTGHISIIMPP